MFDVLLRDDDGGAVIRQRYSPCIFLVTLFSSLFSFPPIFLFLSLFFVSFFSLAARLKVSDLTVLAVQMWSHIMLLPHAQIGGGDGNSNMSLERRLQTLLGAVSSHWPSFEPLLHRVANRIGNTMQQSHAVGIPLDQGQMSLNTSAGLVRERAPEAYRPHEMPGAAGSGETSSLPETLRYKRFDPSEKGRRRKEIPSLQAQFVSGNSGHHAGAGRSSSGW